MNASIIRNMTPPNRTLWEQGDAQAREHVERYLDLLAVCLGNILTIVDPDLLVIGEGSCQISLRLQNSCPGVCPDIYCRSPACRALNARDTGTQEGMRGAHSFISPVVTRLLCCRVAGVDSAVFAKINAACGRRLRQRIFFRDRMMPEAMDKPRVVVLTGAGISAESGIQTFRAADGLWEEHRVEDVATPEGFARDPALVQAFYNTRRRQLQQPEIAPNAAHAQSWRSASRIDLLVTGTPTIFTKGPETHNIIHMHGELLGCGAHGVVRCWSGRGRAGRRPLPLLSVPFASASACGLVWRNAAGNG